MPGYRKIRRRRRVVRRPRRRMMKVVRKRGRSNLVADGTYTEKLTYETELYVQANQATFAFHWARSGNAAATEQFPVGTVTGNSQYSQCATMFRSYMITSVKFEYRPYFYSAGGGATYALKSLTVGTKMDIEGAQAVPVPLSEYRASLDAKQYDPQRPFKRFYRIAQWSKGREIDWRTTQTASANGYGNATPDCMTCMEMDCGGFDDGTLIGAVRVTYYVKFKSRVRD